MDAWLASLQDELLEIAGDKVEEDRIGDMISDLCEDRKDILAEAAERTDLQSRMNDMVAFLEKMPTAITEYSEVITRRLIDRIAIFDEKIVVELK